MVFRAKTVAVVPGLCAFLGHLSKFSLTLPMANADVALFSLKILQSETNCALSFGIHNVFGLFNAPLLGFHTSRHKILSALLRSSVGVLLRQVVVLAGLQTHVFLSLLVSVTWLCLSTLFV